MCKLKKNGKIQTVIHVFGMKDEVKLYFSENNNGNSVSLLVLN